MSIIKTCDWCGENIGCNERFATWSVAYQGREFRDSNGGGYIGHYHAVTGGRNCEGEILERFVLVQEAASSIERIPVTTTAKINRLRGKHVKPSTEGAA